MASDFRYHAQMTGIVADEIAKLQSKDMAYGASWKKRGGIGAYMMLARKWDRIEQFAEKYGYDLFKMMDENPGDVLDDINDLRGYLLLALAYDRQRIDDALAGDKHAVHETLPRTVPRFGDNQDMSSLHPVKTMVGYEYMGARLEDNMTAHEFDALPRECKPFFALNEQGRYTFLREKFEAFIEPFKKG